MDLQGKINFIQSMAHEISGFGGDYEQQTRDLTCECLEHLHKFWEGKNILAEDGKHYLPEVLQELDDVIDRNPRGASGAMAGAAKQHGLGAFAEWDRYFKELSRPIEKLANSHSGGLPEPK